MAHLLRESYELFEPRLGDPFSFGDFLNRDIRHIRTSWRIHLRFFYGTSIAKSAIAWNSLRLSVLYVNPAFVAWSTRAHRVTLFHAALSQMARIWSAVRRLPPGRARSE